MISFEEGDHKYTWFVVNDPVMGGRSKSTFTDVNGVGIFNGTVAIVPSLKVSTRRMGSVHATSAADHDPAHTYALQPHTILVL